MAKLPNIDMLSLAAYTPDYEDYALDSSISCWPCFRYASDVPYTLVDSHYCIFRRYSIFWLIIGRNARTSRDCAYYSLLYNLCRRIDGTVAQKRDWGRTRCRHRNHHGRFICPCLYWGPPVQRLGFTLLWSYSCVELGGNSNCPLSNATPLPTSGISELDRPIIFIAG